MVWSLYLEPLSARLLGKSANFGPSERRSNCILATKVTLKMKWQNAQRAVSITKLQSINIPKKDAVADYSSGGF